MTRIVSERDLLRAVREEIRLAGLTSEPLPAVPPPNDIAAEELIVSAILCAQVRPVELGELEAHHFYQPIHRWTYQTIVNIHDAGLDLCRDLVFAAAEDQGLPSTELEELWISPWRSAHELQRLAGVVVEMWRRRELCRVIAEVDLRLRTGSLDYERALRRLAKGVR